VPEDKTGLMSVCLPLEKQTQTTTHGAGRGQRSLPAAQLCSFPGEEKKQGLHGFQKLLWGGGSGQRKLCVCCGLHTHPHTETQLGSPCFQPWLQDHRTPQLMACGNSRRPPHWAQPLGPDRGQQSHRGASVSPKDPSLPFWNALLLSSATGPSTPKSSTLDGSSGRNCWSSLTFCT
jgi:hypothetical protein